MPIDSLNEQERRHSRPPSPPSENIFLNTIRLSRDGLLLLQLPNQTIIDASEAWLEMTGLDRAAAVGKNARELDIWETAGDFERFAQILGGRRGEVEVTFRPRTTAGAPARAALLAADRIELEGAACALVIWRARRAADGQNTENTSEESDAWREKVAAKVSACPDFNSSLVAAQRELCAAGGWDYAEAWLPAIDGRCCAASEAWYSTEASLKDFKLKSEDYQFAVGKGLPGQALESKRPVWVEDLAAHESFRRQTEARAARLKSALAVPVVADPEGTVAAILVFFSHARRAPEPALAERTFEALKAAGACLKRRLLEVERERLAEILETTPDLVGIADAEGRVIYQNAAARRFFGINEQSADAATATAAAESGGGISAGGGSAPAPPAAGPGGAIADFHPPEVADMIASVALPAAIRDGSWEGETSVLDRQKRPVPISQTIIAHKARDGTVKFFSSIGRDISKRKSAEEALHLSEKRFRALIENSSDIIAIHDGDGIIRYESPSVSRVLGYRPEELVGKPVLDLIHPDEREAAREAMRRAREGAHALGPYATVELKFLHKDGSSRVIQCTCSNLLDEPAVGGIIFNGRDITEQKEMLKALQTTVTELRTLFEAMNDVILVFDGDGRYLKIAPTHPELLYRPRQEMIGKTLHEVFPPEQADYFLNGIREALETGRSVRLEYTLVIDDREVYFVAIVSPMTRNSVIFVARDITEPKLFEKRLRESQNQLQLAQRIACLGSWEWNVRTGEFTLSDEGFRILGLEPQVFKPTPEKLAAYVLPEDFELVKKMTRVSLEEKRAVQFDYRVLRADGEVRTVHSIREPILDEQGNVVRIIGTTQDITETLELENQLRQAQKMEAIGRLAGGIAHDFNNMLTAINGYSSLILRQIEPENPVRQKVEEIKKAGERAAMLTHQLLTFSRKQVLKPRIVSLNDTVTDIYKMLERLIGEDIEFQTYLSPDLGQVEADPGQISQVIVNLVINARDAMPRGGRLTIETVNVFLTEDYAAHHLGAHAGYYVMLAVSDTGTGMTPEVQRRIFEPFFTTKEVGKGTGMGLPTVYGIVKQSGGYIWVYSEADKGTTFKIYLPRVDKTINEAGTPAAHMAVGTEGLPTGTETILLVEDEDSVRELTRQILEMCGYRVMEASNGADALKIYDERRWDIDLLITDLVMPQMSGRQLVERLSETLSDLRVLYMSGYTNNSVIHHGILDDGTNFLQKPFTPELLALKVRQILDASHGAAEADVKES